MRRLICSCLFGYSGFTRLDTTYSTEGDDYYKADAGLVTVETWVFDEGFADFAESRSQS